MDLLVFLAALASAALHATWNSAARSRTDPGLGFAVVVYGGGIVSLPVLPFTGLPPAVAWPWIVAACLANLVAVRALMATYRRAPLTVGYPISRGLAPVGITIIAALTVGEIPSLFGVLGVVTVSLSLLLLAGEALLRRETPVSGLLLAALSGVLTACAVFADAQGVRTATSVLGASSVLGYGATQAVVNAIALAVLSELERRPIRHIPPVEWRFGVLMATVSMISYLLLLYGFTHGPLATVSALRETSPIFATAIAAFVLGERVRPLKWLAVAVAVCGVAMIRLG
jgi:drug/metabolite transporter (DMT)-like permease